MEATEEEKIIYVKRGVANRFDDRIELHEDLKYDQELHDWVLHHELRHSKVGVSGSDILQDLTFEGTVRLQYKLYAFMMMRPSTWWQFSPIYPASDGLHLDMSLILLYAFMIPIIAFMFYWTLRFLAV